MNIYLLDEKNENIIEIPSIAILTFAIFVENLSPNWMIIYI